MKTKAIIFLLGMAFALFLQIEPSEQTQIRRCVENYESNASGCKQMYGSDNE